MVYAIVGTKQWLEEGPVHWKIGRFGLQMQEVQTHDEDWGSVGGHASENLSSTLQDQF